jgi:hypothetical protein
MNVFFRRRCSSMQGFNLPAASAPKPFRSAAKLAIAQALQVDCDEVLLGRTPEG